MDPSTTINEFIYKPINSIDYVSKNKLVETIYSRSTIAVPSVQSAFNPLLSDSLNLLYDPKSLMATNLSFDSNISIVTHPIHDHRANNFILDTFFNEVAEGNSLIVRTLKNKEKFMSLEAFLSQYNIDVEQLKRQNIIVKHSDGLNSKSVPYIPNPPASQVFPRGTKEKFGKSYQFRGKKHKKSLIEFIKYKNKEPSSYFCNNANTLFSGLSQSAFRSHSKHNQKFNSRCSITTSYLDENSFCSVVDNINARHINRHVCEAIQTQNIDGIIRQRKRKFPVFVDNKNPSSSIKTNFRKSPDGKGTNKKTAKPIATCSNVSDARPSGQDIFDTLMSGRELVCRTCDVSFRTNKLLAIHILRTHVTIN